jgi:hypothetical protein
MTLTPQLTCLWEKLLVDADFIVLLIVVATFDWTPVPQLS